MTTNQAVVSLTYRTLSAERNDALVAVLSLNRPQRANAFHGDMVSLISRYVDEVQNHADVRALILRGVGRNFCGGADLEWMNQVARMNRDENLSEAMLLQQMFEKLSNLDVPTIGLTQGAAFGGAVGLLATCDFVLASADARFSLSEVRVGLIPAVIMPYLGRRMNSAALKRLILSGSLFDANEAMRTGLVDEIAPAQEIDARLRHWLNEFCLASPVAQKKAKQLFIGLQATHFKQSPVTAEAIAEIRSSPSGQKGLQAFLNKRSAPWQVNVDEKWKLDV